LIAELVSANDLVANGFQAFSQASMMSAKLGNTESVSQWLRR
jgi:hypothetical protein